MEKQNLRQMGPGVPDFEQTLENHGLFLERGETHTCQVNLGLLCNQVCKHCHLSAGPDRKELMDLDTIFQVVEFTQKTGCKVVDITGGAPEMNPHLPVLIDKMAGLEKVLMLRSNLSALYDANDPGLLDLLVKHQVTIVSSLPSLNLSQTDAQRGQGVFEKSIMALKLLNDRGYGKEGTGLVLDLVSNPTGAFMPTDQIIAEKRFRQVLQEKWGIVFSRLFTFANMPLGRFEVWLKKKGTYTSYLQSLWKGFNPCTVEGLMCRNLISISWDGYLYDCDFNQAAGLPMANLRTHIND
ncbi:MAG: arsenosugar biosynthesis radical SAM protein ArsS, partial [Proteobacteria bacterium]|nr:arsenosugar biosynthesis radical SAM protein ArsS [Pseudomonadota bacterium]